MKNTLLFFMLFYITTTAYTQINIQHKGSLKDLFSILQQKHGYKFVYSNDDIDDRKPVSINVTNSTIVVVMDEVAKQIHVSYRIINKQIILSRIKTKTGKPVAPAKRSPTISVSPPPSTSTQNRIPASLPLPDSTNHIVPPDLKTTDSQQQEAIRIDLQEAPLTTRTDTKDTPEDIPGNLVSGAKVLPQEKNDNAAELPEQSDNIVSSTSVLPVNQEKGENIDVSISTDTSSIFEQTLTEVTPDSLPVEANQPTEPAKSSRIRNTLLEFSIQNNALYDLILTPNLSIECKIENRWGVILTGLWTHIKWGKGSKTYRTWAVSPEARYYFSKNRRFYAGVMFHIGQWNLKLSETGKQGDFVGGGITGGYLLPVKDFFSMDFGIGLGYTYFKYDTYSFIDGLNRRRGSGRKNFWGPTKIAVTFIFKLY